MNDLDRGDTVKIIFLIIALTGMMIYGNVYANDTIDALEKHLEEEQKELHTKSIDELILFDRLHNIHQYMKQQERDNKVIKEWENHQNEVPCDSIFRDGLKCEKVKI